MGLRTVEAHLTTIYRKLGAQRRTQLGPALTRLGVPEPASSPKPLTH
jgi:DNA-binding CsgD family transcriptional regulator